MNILSVLEPIRELVRKKNGLMCKLPRCNIFWANQKLPSQTNIWWHSPIRHFVRRLVSSDHEILISHHLSWCPRYRSTIFQTLQINYMPVKIMQIKWRLIIWHAKMATFLSKFNYIQLHWVSLCNNASTEFFMYYSIMSTTVYESTWKNNR